ncbi:hypothetical protein NMG60_11003366 [Bertholletia excelsa]
MMDKKFKGARWVGNICQKFEVMCQEVDDFVGQDPVKYVENQVQTVGDSVRRFYSNIVQDLLPPSLAEPGNNEAQAASPEQNDIGTFLMSMLGIEEKPPQMETNQPYVEQDLMDLENNHEKSLHPTVNGMKKSDSDLSLGTEIGALSNNSADAFFKETGAKEELTDKNSGIVAEENETNKKLIDKKSNIVEENDMEDKASQLEEMELICDNGLTEAMLLSESVGENNGIISEDPQETLVYQAQKEAGCTRLLGETKSFSDSSSMVLPSEMDFSVVFGDNKAVEVGLISSSNSLHAETYGTPQLLNVNICDYLNVLSSSLQSSNSYCQNKDEDVRLAIYGSALSLESTDTFTADDATSLAGSYGNWKEYCPECTQLEALVSSLELGDSDDRFDIADPSLETIELTKKAKLDESCVIVDSRLLHAVSCIAPKHRSYKKILQDAFASKKRLRREYEQLAILYGDIDEEPDQKPLQKLLDANTSSSSDLCDPEWEIL